MDARTEARRELVLAAVLLVALAGIVPLPTALIVAAMTGLAVAVASIGVFGRADPRSVPLASVVLGGLLAAGSAGAIRLVPTGLAWVPVLGLVGLGLRAVLRVEGRLVGATASPSDDDRLRLLTAVIGVAFVAFTGVAALVPGALADPGGPPATSPGLPDPVVTLVVADALVAALLGFRASALRYPGFRDRVWSAATFGVVIAVAAGVGRAIGLPRLVGPAVLTLVLYLWDTVHGAGSARRRESRFVWETVLLVLLGIVVVAWNLRLA